MKLVVSMNKHRNVYWKNKSHLMPQTLKKLNTTLLKVPYSWQSGFRVPDPYCIPLHTAPVKIFVFLFQGRKSEAKSSQVWMESWAAKRIFAKAQSRIKKQNSHFHFKAKNYRVHQKINRPFVTCKNNCENNWQSQNSRKHLKSTFEVFCAYIEGAKQSLE